MTWRARALSLVGLGTLLGLLSLTSAADAQQATAPRRIGVLLVGPSPDSKEAQAFRRGLRDAGHAEGRDIVIEWRSAAGDYARAPELAADLVESKVDVIVVNSTLAARAVRRATSTIPIVMLLVADPVGSGLVRNLAHPGENITGLSMMANELVTKRLQLLKETIPRLTRVTVLWTPDTPLHTQAVEDLKAAAPYPRCRSSSTSSACERPRRSIQPSRLPGEPMQRACTSSGTLSSLPIERHFSNWPPRPGYRASTRRGTSSTKAG